MRRGDKIELQLKKISRLNSLSFTMRVAANNKANIKEPHLIFEIYKQE